MRGFQVDVGAPQPHQSRCPVMRTCRFVHMLFVTLLALLTSPVSAGYAGSSTAARLTKERAMGVGRAATSPQNCAGGAGHCAATRGGRPAVWKGHNHRRRSCGFSLCEGDEGHGVHVTAEDDGGGESPSKPVLVLGAGWVGSRMAQSIVEDGTPVYATHRPGTKADDKPPYFRPVPLGGLVPPVKMLEFDLDDPATWTNLPAAESFSAAIVTFPLSSGPQAFWDAYLERVPNVLCYSTTSVYQVQRPGERVDEHSPIRETPRAVAEAYCQERGATLLTISGIFGERRSPRGICTCLSTYTTSGGALNGNKNVNMVHIDDIVAATRAILKKPQPHARINIAGHHFLLSELIAHCKHPEIPAGPDTDLSSKCVCSDHLLTNVMPPGYSFRPPMETAA